MNYDSNETIEWDSNSKCNYYMDLFIKLPIENSSGSHASWPAVTKQSPTSRFLRWLLVGIFFKRLLTWGSPWAAPSTSATPSFYFLYLKRGYLGQRGKVVKIDGSKCRTYECPAQKFVRHHFLAKFCFIKLIKHLSCVFSLTTYK